MWNWQHKIWPVFSYDAALLADYEQKFVYQSGMLWGLSEQLCQEDQNFFIIDMMSQEALKTSEIEGEYLDRDSVQSSI